MKFINLKTMSALLLVASLGFIGCGKKDAPTTQQACEQRNGRWANGACTGYDNKFSEVNLFSSDGAISTYEVVDYHQDGHTINIEVDNSEENE